MLLNQNGIRRVGALGLLSIAAGAAHAGALAPLQKASADSRMSTDQAKHLLAARSAQFIENKGQWDPKARFLARTENLDLWFTDQGIRYDNHVSTGGTGHRYQGHAVGMTFLGGRAVKPIASSKTRTRIDFINGKSRTKGVSAYHELYSKNVYDGIDVRSYFDDTKPRYDVIVAPGADAKQVKFGYEGDNGLSIKNGALRIATSVGGFSNGKPFAYQTVGGKRVPVAASWKLVGKHQATFALGAYDHSKPLVIDPLVYGSYFGGNGGADEIRAVVADEDGGVYLAGATYSDLFPVRYGPFGLNRAGGSDALIAKLQGDAYNFDYAAYIGGSYNDVGQFLKRDGAGNVWLAGTTQSTDFPGYDRGYTQFLQSNAQQGFALATGGTFRIGVNDPSTSNRYTTALPYNATATQVQTALRNAGFNATVTPVLRDGNGNLITQLPNAKFQIDLPASDRQQFTVDSVYRTRTDNTGTTTVINEGLPPSYHLLSPPAPVNPTQADPVGSTLTQDNPFANTQRFRLYGSLPLTGSFTISFRNYPATGAPTLATTAAIPYNAQTSVIQDQLTALGNRGTINFAVSGGPIPVDNLGNRPTVTVTMTDTANPPGPSPQKALIFNNSGLIAQMAYVINPETGPATIPADQSDIFVMRFEKSSSTVLDPTTNPAILIFGSADTDRFASFDIRPGATATDPVEFILAGSTKHAILNYPNVVYPGSGYEWTGFLSRYRWSLTTGFTQVATTPNANNPVDPVNDLPYVRSQSGFQVDLRGAVLDSDGNAYVAGTLYYGGNANTGTTSSVFYTGNNVGSTLFKYDTKEYGNQARNVDVFVRKYGPTGSTIFSGLIGGTNNDEAGGLGLALDGTYVNTGSPIAIDAARNVYVTGTSGSFDFIRTRGVYGGVFTDADNVFVTKISADGQNILYSTNLGMASNGIPVQATLYREQPPQFANGAGFAAITPAGIAVDSRGNAYVTTNLRPNDVTFPGGPTATPPNPNQPTGSTLPAIPLVGALDATYDSPTGAEFPTTEGGLTVLNPTGTDLNFSTYLGGKLDDFVYAPYVDTAGDVWTVGWTDSRRDYGRGNTPYTTTSQLPDSLISAFAFKQTPDYQSSSSFAISAVAYGTLNNNSQVATLSLDQYGYVTPNYVPMSYSRDGFIAKMRIGLASVANITLTPVSLPGGLGNYVTGTVTLSEGAPSGGGTVVITLPGGSTYATLSSTVVAGAQNGSVSTLNIPVAAGATTVQFYVYTKAVTAPTSVNVRGTFSGTFKETAFQIVPYLSRITLAADTMVGGDPNRLQGTVTLSGNAVTDTDVVITTSDPDYAFVASTPVTVRAGQNTAQFAIASHGVNANRALTVSANLLGVTLSSPLTLTPASLSSITLNPDTIGGGGKSTVSVSLNGEAGPGGHVVNLSASATPSGAPTLSSTSITIPQNSVTATDAATITAPFVETNTTSTITATSAVNGSTLSATLTISPSAIASVTLNPATVASGGVSTGTVTLSTAAPTGGTYVYVRASSGLAYFTGASNGVLQVFIAGGSKTGTFTVNAGYVGVDTAVTITVGPTANSLTTGGSTTRTATLTIQAATFSVSLSPTSVVGGEGTVTGTVTLTNAPKSTVYIAVSSSNPAVASINGADSNGTYLVPIAANSTTGTFTITTKAVAASTNVTISATAGGAAKTAILTVNPVGVLSVKATPTSVRGGTGYLTLLVTFNGTTATTGNDNMQVKFSLDAAIDQTSPRNFTVPAGYRTYQLVYRVNRVSRSQTVTATVTYHGTSATTTFTVLR